jgi:hypothetical protein
MYKNDVDVLPRQGFEGQGKDKQDERTGKNYFLASNPLINPRICLRKMNASIK